MNVQCGYFYGQTTLFQKVTNTSKTFDLFYHLTWICMTEKFFRFTRKSNKFRTKNQSVVLMKETILFPDSVFKF